MWTGIFRLSSNLCHAPFPVQAEKRKENGVNEVKRKFEREQAEMRREVDRELGKIRYWGTLGKTGNHVDNPIPYML